MLAATSAPRVPCRTRTSRSTACAEPRAGESRGAARVPRRVRHRAARRRRPPRGLRQVLEQISSAPMRPCCRSMMLRSSSRPCTACRCRPRQRRALPQAAHARISPMPHRRYPDLLGTAASRRCSPVRATSPATGRRSASTVAPMTGSAPTRPRARSSAGSSAAHAGQSGRGLHRCSSVVPFGLFRHARRALRGRAGAHLGSGREDYQPRRARARLVGERSGVRHRLADRVKVQVVRSIWPRARSISISRRTSAPTRGAGDRAHAPRQGQAMKEETRQRRTVPGFHAMRRCCASSRDVAMLRRALRRSAAAFGMRACARCSNARSWPAACVGIACRLHLYTRLDT